MRVDLRQAKLELDEDREVQEEVFNLETWGTDDPVEIQKRRNEVWDFGFDEDDDEDSVDRAIRTAVADRRRNEAEWLAVARFWDWEEGQE